MIVLCTGYTNTYTWLNVLKVAASAINAEINTDNYDTDLSDTDTTDSDGDEETPAKKVFKCCKTQFCVWLFIIL